MTATLSPAEQAEVTRFGMFDKEILEDLEKNWGDTVPCARDDCDTPAVWRVGLRCCPGIIVLCQTHHGESIQRLIRYTALGPVHCVTCRHTWAKNTPVDEIIWDGLL